MHLHSPARRAALVKGEDCVLIAQLGERISKEDALQLSTALFDEGMEHFLNDRFAESIPLFDQSLSINERHMAPSALGLCTNLNNLASAYDQLGQKDTAIYFYERAACVINHPSAVWDEQRRRARDHVLGKLGRMTNTARPDGDGAETADEMRAAQRVAAVMWEEGLRLYAANRPREALSLFEYVLSFNRKHRPTDAAALATTMNNVGAAYEKLGNAAVAITYFRAAIETLERSSLPNKEARIAHVTNRLAQLGVDANGASIPARAFTPPRVGAAPAAVQPACAERPAAHAGVGVATGERGPQNGCGASIAAMDARSQRAAAAASVASVGLSRDREVAE